MRLLVGFTCILVAFGCSDDDKVRRLPDGPPAPDASLFGPVTLTILDGTDPRVGVQVLFQNLDSSVVSETTTGSDGKATAMMAPGGFVTALDPFPNTPQGIASSELRTFGDVKPGDELRLYQPSSSSVSIDVTVLLPIAPNASEYRISTNCYLGYPVFVGGGGSGSSGQPQATMQLSGCSATSNLLVEALDGNNAVMSSIYKPSVALVANATIDLTQDTYTAVPDVTFTYTNVPASSSVVNVDSTRSTTLGPIFYGGASAPVAGSVATVTTRIPVIPNATAITTSSMYGDSTYHAVSDWGPAPTAYTLDVGAALLPDFADPPALDVPNHRVAWTTTGGAVQPDVLFVSARFGRETPQQRWIWQIATAGTNQVVFPVLPASQAQLNPLATDFTGVEVRTAKVPGGYDTVRANILSDSGFDVAGIAPTGRVHTSFYQPAQKGIAAPPATKPTGVLRGLRRR